MARRVDGDEQLNGTLNVTGAVDLDSTLNVDGASTFVGAITVNDAGADVDVRMEGDTNANLFLLDASIDGVGIGVAPTTRLGVQAGTSSNDAAVGGVLYVTTTGAGNVGTGEDDLASYSVPANTLAVNGQSLWYEVWGKVAGNANAKTIRVKFGTDTVFTSLNMASSVGTWRIRGRIIRTGAATQLTMSDHVQDGGAFAAASSTGLTQTLSGALTFKVTGEAVSNNDITLEGMIVGFDSNNT